MIGFEIVSISKPLPCSHQKCSHLWRAEVLIFVTNGHINHKIYNCSQLSYCHNWSHNSQNRSKCSLLITIFTFIMSNLSLVLIGKNCHKWSKLSQMFRIVRVAKNCDNLSKFSNCSKLLEFSKIVQNSSNWSQLSE